jgi:hypothetical protein
MVAGELSLQLTFQPLPAFVILALGAVAITAGAEQKVLLAALFALIDERAVFFGLEGKEKGSGLERGQYANSEKGTGYFLR